LHDYKQAYQQYKNIEKEFGEITLKANQAKADADYFSFQFNQLDAVRLKEGEQEELESELAVLNHSEELK